MKGIILVMISAFLLGCAHTNPRASFNCTITPDQQASVDAARKAMEQSAAAAYADPTPQNWDRATRDAVKATQLAANAAADSNGCD